MWHSGGRRQGESSRTGARFKRYPAQAGGTNLLVPELLKLGRAQADVTQDAAQRADLQRAVPVDRHGGALVAPRKW
jgi:hypothetical protein